MPSIFLAYENSAIGTSYSKDISIPGERVGYLAVNPRCEHKGILMDGMTIVNRTLGFINAPALMQRVIGRIQGTCVDMGEYARKRDLLCEGLSACGYEFVKPEGAFYIFPRSPLEDDTAFVRELQKHNVLAVPGRGFGTPGYFRICYCVEDWVIEGSLAGFRSAAREFGLCQS